MLEWDLTSDPTVEVAATLEVLDRPNSTGLYFWALSADVVDDWGRAGGVQIGLQEHPFYGDGAINFGGTTADGRQLDGTSSDLPSAIDANTRLFAWEQHRRYRLRIARSPEFGWRGSATDLQTGVETVVRDLWSDGSTLDRPMVRAQVFADCGDPAAAVRWSDLTVTGGDGRAHRIETVVAKYQSYEAGGCTNTNSEVDEIGFVQRTATRRANPHGTPLRLE